MFRRRLAFAALLLGLVTVEGCRRADPAIVEANRAARAPQNQPARLYVLREDLIATAGAALAVEIDGRRACEVAQGMFYRTEMPRRRARVAVSSVGGPNVGSPSIEVETLGRGDASYVVARPLDDGRIDVRQVDEDEARRLLVGARLANCPTQMGRASPQPAPAVRRQDGSGVVLPANGTVFTTSDGASIRIGGVSAAQCSFDLVDSRNLTSKWFCGLLPVPRQETVRNARQIMTRFPLRPGDQFDVQVGAPSATSTTREVAVVGRETIDVGGRNYEAVIVEITIKASPRVAPSDYFHDVVVGAYAEELGFYLRFTHHRLVGPPMSPTGWEIKEIRMP